jgi:hypothetical protein
MVERRRKPLLEKTKKDPDDDNTRKTWMNQRQGSGQA